MKELENLEPIKELNEKPIEETLNEPDIFFEKVIEDTENFWLND